MKTTVRQLRRIIREAKPKKIGASPEYMKKEAARESLQNMVLRQMYQIETEEQLKDVFKTMDMALMALKQVPLAVWKKLAMEKAMGGSTDV